MANKWIRSICADTFWRRTDADGTRQLREGSFIRDYPASEGGGFEVFRIRFYAKHPYKAMQTLLDKLNAGEDVTPLADTNIN